METRDTNQPDGVAGGAVKEETTTVSQYAGQRGMHRRLERAAKEACPEELSALHRPILPTSLTVAKLV